MKTPTKLGEALCVQPVAHECALEVAKPVISAKFARSLHSALSHLSCHSITVAHWEALRFQKPDIPARTRPITTEREETEFQVAYWRKFLAETGQWMGGVEALRSEAGQSYVRRTGEILRGAPPTVCVDRLLGVALAAVVASWDAFARGDMDNAWLNLISAHHTEGLIQGIMIVAENAALSGSLQRKKPGAKSKAIYDRLLTRAREIKAQKPKFSRAQIAGFLSVFEADRTRKPTGGEFQLTAKTIERRLRGLDIGDK